eukprot:3469713-Prymnesium_polylepis.1
MSGASCIVNSVARYGGAIQLLYGDTDAIVSDGCAIVNSTATSIGGAFSLQHPTARVTVSNSSIIN